jgi:hypothetical protein
VTSGEAEFEIDFVREGDDPGTDTYHVHVRCFSSWTSAPVIAPEAAPAVRRRHDP